MRFVTQFIRDFISSLLAQRTRDVVAIPVRRSAPGKQLLRSNRKSF